MIIPMRRDKTSWFAAVSAGKRNAGGGNGADNRKYSGGDEGGERFGGWGFVAGIGHDIFQGLKGGGRDIEKERNTGAR